MTQGGPLEFWRVHLEDEVAALSPVLAETMAARPAPGGCDHRPTLALIRRQRPYALLGPRDLRLPHLDAGLAFLRRRGLPAYVRVGGGSLVVLDEDCLSFALGWPCVSPGHVASTVRAMAEPVATALRAFGLETRLGAAVGSYCEGPSDMVVADGRKVVGMATALRGGWALVSGMILVRQDPRYATGVVAGFETAAGGDRRYRWQAVTSLEAAYGRGVDPEKVADALEAALARWAAGFGRGLERRGPSAQDKAYAASLLVRRRRMAGADQAVDA